MTTSVFVTLGALAIGTVVVVEWYNRRRLAAFFAKRPALTPRQFATTYFSPDRAEIAEFVSHTLHELTSANFTRLHPSDRFREDLRLSELDSLAPVQILAFAEDRFGITITDAEAAEIRTVEDLVNLIAEKCKRGAAV